LITSGRPWAGCEKLSRNPLRSQDGLIICKVAPELKVPPGKLNNEPNQPMNTTRYQSIGSRAFSAGMRSKSHQEDIKETPANLCAEEGDVWWSHWDTKWINHYDEEWMAFIGEHSNRVDRTADEEGLPCVWNLPDE
jgi:hypothetical protein